LAHFESYVMICNSTGNQPVNLMPAIQFGIKHIIALSTEEAIRQAWTERLSKVAQKHAIVVQPMEIPASIEKSLPDLIEKLLNSINDFPMIVWNISGGQKIPTIALHDAFQRRIQLGFHEDQVLYTEGRPPTVWMYGGNYFMSSFRSNAYLTMEDILTLYGSILVKGEMLYPKSSPEVVDNLEIGRRALQFFKQNKYFREVFFRIMHPSPEYTKSRNDVEAMIKNILNQLKPNLNSITVKHHKGYENFEYEIKKVFSKIDRVSDVETLRTLLKPLTLIQKPKEIYKDYWLSIRNRIVEGVLEKFAIQKHPLFTQEPTQGEIKRLVSEISSIGGKVNEYSGQLCKEDILQISKITRPGLLFEWMVAASVIDLISQNSNISNCISEVHSNVVTKRADAPYAKPDSELDLVITTRFGTLIIFEMKTYEFSGDVAKSKEGTAYKKSGPFGSAVIIGPIMHDMIFCSVKGRKQYDSYIDPVTQAQEETAWQNNIPYWYLDDISVNLRKVLYIQE